MADISLFFYLKRNNNFELWVLFHCDLQIYVVEKKKENDIVHLFQKTYDISLIDTWRKDVTRRYSIY